MAREYRKWEEQTYFCSCCDRVMRANGSRADGRANYGSHGRCTACVNRLRRATARAAVVYPRLVTPRDHLLTEVEHLRVSGVRMQDIPRRVSMSPAAFERAMYRARAAGDPRATAFRGMAA